MIKLDSINYLNTIVGKQPNARFAVAFDGERLGVVAYSLVDDAYGTKAYVWFAERYEGIGLNHSLDLLNQLTNISLNKNLDEVPVYVKGQANGVWTFTKQARNTHNLKVIEFQKKTSGGWTTEEVVMTVRDDLVSGNIKAAPEFEGRPEYEIFNATLRNLKITSEMDVLVEAAIYGLGYWSAHEKRKKFTVGNAASVTVY